MQKLTKSEWKKHIAVLAVIVIVFLFFAGNIYHKFISQGTVMAINTERMSVTRQLNEGDRVVQPFEPVHKKLSELNVYFSTNGNSQNGEGTIHMELIDYDTKEVLAESDINTAAIYDQQRCQFQFSPIDVTDIHPALVIEMKELSSQATISLYLSGQAEQVKETCVLDNENMKYSLQMEYSYRNFGYTECLILFALAALLFILVGIYFLLVVWKRQIHQVYLAAVILLGIVYMFLLPSMVAPDEGTHIYKAIEFSNSLLGYDNSPDHFELRTCENSGLFLHGYMQSLSKPAYDQYYSMFLHGDDSDERTAIEYETYVTPQYQYFLPGIGITLGRLLGLNGLKTFALGMVLNFIFYVALTWLAIRILPFGKAAAAIICLLPISIQQATSYSYDCMIIATAILFFAAFMQLMYDRECTKYTYIIFAVSGMLFLPTKGLAYVPAVVLAGYAALSRRKTDKKAMWKLFGIMGVMLVFTLVIKLFFTNGNAEVVKSASSVPFVKWAQQPGYSLKMLLEHPLKTMDMIWNTIYLKGEFIFTSAFGGKLGWVNLDVSILVVCVYLITAVLAVMPTEKNIGVQMKGSTRILLLLVFFACIACVFAGMLLSWTTISMDYIEGVQGRYFLPVILLALFAFRGKGVRITESLERTCLMAAIVVQPFTVAGILYSIV